jgi:hypothetical protein
MSPQPTPCALLSLLLLVVPSTAARAQQSQSSPAEPPSGTPQSSESLVLGGVTLRLGMPQDDAFSRLRERYNLEKLNSHGLWNVQDGGRVIGAVVFVAGQVASITKEIGEVDTELGLANALYRAVSTYEQRGHSPCEIETDDDSSEPSETIAVTCTGQAARFEISLVGDRGREFVFVSEILAYPPAVRKELERSDAGAAVGENATASEAAQRASDLADSTVLVTVAPSERVPDTDLSKITAHNRALCDQTITVAGLTPRGLALYVPPEGQKFMAKNSQNYPRMCLVEDASKLVPGAPRYLLVYAYSQNAFAGFQPVTRINTTTTPVSGSGTVSNSYGEVWNFTYFGTVESTEIDTIEEPYVIQSRSLYLNAYDESGALVSSHSITLSRQIGGDGASALGYNGAQLIGMLWNNPSRLIKSVLKDVQKDSAKYRN